MATPEQQRAAVERAAARVRSRAPRTVEAQNGRQIMILRPYIELHLPANPLSTSERHRIKALSGDASECRGHSDKRFIKVPLTAAGLQLAEELLARHQWLSKQKHTIIFRHVPRVDDFLTYARTMAAARDAFLAHVRMAHRAGHLPRPLTAAQRHERHVQSLLARREACLRGLEEVNAELVKLGIEVQS